MGAGLAATRAAVALREQGFDGRVTVLGAEGVAPYDRPPLSKELLRRTEPAWLRDELGAGLEVADDVRLAEPATGLRVGDGSVTVHTAVGQVTADAAVLATGAHAVRPPGWDAALTLHTAADAAALRQLLEPGARLVVVGAGWIGAEVAGVAAASGVHVSVVEAAAAPLAGALGEVGALTAPWYRAAGVRLITGARVVTVTRDAVELAEGEVLRADVVLAAVGARPTSAWLGDALRVSADGSLAVDAGYRLFDGPPDVVAVGDLARRRSPRHGWVSGGHWDGALRGPEIAVRSLLGGVAAQDGSDDPAPYVFSTQLGHELNLYGQPGPGDDVVLRGDPTEDFTILWFSGGTELTAVLAVDRPRDVAAARRLFSTPVLPRLDRTVAADPARPLRDAAR